MKKLISLILTLAMLVSVFALFPATVLAADEKLVIGTTASLSGTTVVDSGGNVASDTGIGWTYASNTNTLTISFGFIGDITVNTLGTLNLAVSGTVTTGGSITMAAGDTVNITSGTLTCDNINGDGDVAITGCSVSTTKGILADDITITNAFIITNGDIAATGNVTINSGTVSTPVNITGTAVNITGGFM